MLLVKEYVPDATTMCVTDASATAAESSATVATLTIRSGIFGGGGGGGSDGGSGGGGGGDGGGGNDGGTGGAAGGPKPRHRHTLDDEHCSVAVESELKYGEPLSS